MFFVDVLFDVFKLFKFIILSVFKIVFLKEIIAYDDSEETYRSTLERRRT